MQSSRRLLARMVLAYGNDKSTAITSFSCKKLATNIRSPLLLRLLSSRTTHDDFDGFEDDMGINDSEFRSAGPQRGYRSSGDGQYRQRNQRRQQSGWKPPYRRNELDFDNEDFDEVESSRGQRWNSESRYQGERNELGSRLKAREWSSTQLGSIEKNFYVEHPDVNGMSEEEMLAFYQQHDITIGKGEQIKPVTDFMHANFPDTMSKAMKGMSWQSPTPIQSLGWPAALSGKNMVGIAQTGSGKTLGFVLPALVHIKHQVAHREGPVVLILAPTRELAQQIKSVCAQFGRLMGIQTTAIFGGQSKHIQGRYLMEGPDIVVATPGRLLDFLEMGVLSLGHITYLVLDEADRMLDMGFEPQIRKILSQIRPDRQLLLWSATWPEDIQQLAHDFLGKDFTQVNIGSSQLVANPNIEQTIKVCERQEKLNLLVEELESSPTVAKTLIFVQTKSQVDFLTHRLRKYRFRALSIHGDKSQMVRDKTMHSFKTGQIDVLVATDVASRGLDVDDIKLVVNYDYPNSADDYIHRIGRTARAQKTGKALTFVTDDDSDKMKDLISVLSNASQPVPEEVQNLADLHRSNKKGSKSFGNRRFPRRPFNSGYQRRDSW